MVFSKFKRCFYSLRLPTKLNDVYSYHGIAPESPGPLEAPLDTKFLPPLATLHTDSATSSGSLPSTGPFTSSTLQLLSDDNIFHDPAPVSHMNAPINTTENKRLRTVQGECPWNSDNKEACCCRGSRKSRPVKDCHNLRTQGQFCDNCKTINAERARAKKRRHCEKVARELLAKGATGVKSSSITMGLPAT